MSEDKINHIEEILAHQEQEISTLNQMVTRQWDEIDLLKKLVRRLQESLAETGEGEKLTAAEQAARDKPPHY